MIGIGCRRLWYFGLDGLGILHSLQDLDLSNNQISDLTPPCWGLSAWSSCLCPLTKSVTDAPCGAYQLEWLWLYENQISETDAICGTYQPDGAVPVR
jgi:hypothetical protein